MGTGDERDRAIDDFFATLPFSPDPYQREAVAILESGSSVVVTAPTGAGKTLIAEAGVHLTLVDDRRVFYTTPIKALSNQKFADFRARYGTDRVGLLTGDNVINGEAPVVIMTTEVLRNMIYADSSALDGLGLVVLDEVHYLQDRARGQVWEEVIIHLPENIPLVCLSATIANPEEFTGWVRERRGTTGLVVERTRPVPLESLYLLKDRNRENRLDLLPIFGKDGERPNPDVPRLLKRGRGRRRFVSPRRLETVERMQAESLLPVIYFIFSRAGCDQAADVVAAAGLDLVDASARAEIRRISGERTAGLPEEDLGVLGYATFIARLEAGVAAHHAGMIPAFKETVEELFIRGYVKVVFATETLALGINMPARSVVLERLFKFTGETHELLQAGDYTQLTGRAGRRGIDTRGTAVVLHDHDVPFNRVVSIAAVGSHPLRSSFTPTYNMAVNLVANYSRERAEAVLHASFAQFRAEERRAQIQAQVDEKVSELEGCRTSAECDRGDIWEFATEAGAADSAGRVLRDFAQATRDGDVISLTGASEDRWIVLARGRGASPRILILSSAGEVRRMRPEQLSPTVIRMGAMGLPDPVRSRDAAYRRRVSRDLAAWESDDGKLLRPEPVDEAHPVGSCPEVAAHLRWVRRSERLEVEIRRLRRRLERRGKDLVTRFRSYLELLDERGYVRGWALTDRGERLRFLYNGHDVLLAESIERGLFDDLEPAELAAFASMFTYEARRSGAPGGLSTERVADRTDVVIGLGDDLNTAERRKGLPETPPVDPSFGSVVYGWAEGAMLEDLFEDDLVAGDFVRNCRQLLDLLRQLRDAYPWLAVTVRGAIRAIDRGVVAIGGQL